MHHSHVYNFVLGESEFWFPKWLPHSWSVTDAQMEQECRPVTTVSTCYTAPERKHLGTIDPPGIFSAWRGESLQWAHGVNSNLGVAVPNAESRWQLRERLLVGSPESVGRRKLLVSGSDSRGDRKGPFWFLAAESTGSSNPAENQPDRLDQLQG